MVYIREDILKLGGLKDITDFTIFKRRTPQSNYSFKKIKLYTPINLISWHLLLKCITVTDDAGDSINYVLHVCGCTSNNDLVDSEVLDVEGDRIIFTGDGTYKIIGSMVLKDNNSMLKAFLRGFPSNWRSILDDIKQKMCGNVCNDNSYLKNKRKFTSTCNESEVYSEFKNSDKDCLEESISSMVGEQDLLEDFKNKTGINPKDYIFKSDDFVLDKKITDSNIITKEVTSNLYKEYLKKNENCKNNIQTEGKSDLMNKNHELSLRNQIKLNKDPMPIYEKEENTNTGYSSKAEAQDLISTLNNPILAFNDTTDDIKMPTAWSKRDSKKLKYEFYQQKYAKECEARKLSNEKKAKKITVADYINNNTIFKVCDSQNLNDNSKAEDKKITLHKEKQSDKIDKILNEKELNNATDKKDEMFDSKKVNDDVVKISDTQTEKSDNDISTKIEHNIFVKGSYIKANEIIPKESNEESLGKINYIADQKESFDVPVTNLIDEKKFKESFDKNKAYDFLKDIQTSNKNFNKIESEKYNGKIYFSKINVKTDNKKINSKKDLRICNKDKKESEISADQVEERNNLGHNDNNKGFLDYNSNFTLGSSLTTQNDLLMDKNYSEGLSTKVEDNNNKNKDFDEKKHVLKDIDDPNLTKTNETEKEKTLKSNYYENKAKILNNDLQKNNKVINNETLITMPNSSSRNNFKFDLSNVDKEMVKTTKKKNEKDLSKDENVENDNIVDMPDFKQLFSNDKLKHEILGTKKEIGYESKKTLSQEQKNILEKKNMINIKSISEKISMPDIAVTSKVCHNEEEQNSDFISSYRENQERIKNNDLNSGFMSNFDVSECNIDLLSEFEKFVKENTTNDKKLNKNNQKKSVNTSLIMEKNTKKSTRNSTKKENLTSLGKNKTNFLLATENANRENIMSSFLFNEPGFEEDVMYGLPMSSILSENNSSKIENIEFEKSKNVYSDKLKDESLVNSKDLNSLPHENKNLNEEKSFNIEKNPISNTLNFKIAESESKNVSDKNKKTKLSKLSDIMKNELKNEILGHANNDVQVDKENIDENSTNLNRNSTLDDEKTNNLLFQPFSTKNSRRSSSKNTKGKKENSLISNNLGKNSKRMSVKIEKTFELHSDVDESNLKKIDSVKKENLSISDMEKIESEDNLSISAVKNQKNIKVKTSDLKNKTTINDKLLQRPRLSNDLENKKRISNDQLSKLNKDKTNLTAYNQNVIEAKLLDNIDSSNNMKMGLEITKSEKNHNESLEIDDIEVTDIKKDTEEKLNVDEKSQDISKPIEIEIDNNYFNKKSNETKKEIFGVLSSLKASKKQNNKSKSFILEEEKNNLKANSNNLSLDIIKVSEDFEDKSESVFSDYTSSNKNNLIKKTRRKKFSFKVPENFKVSKTFNTNRKTSGSGRKIFKEEDEY